MGLETAESGAEPYKRCLSSDGSTRFVLCVQCTTGRRRRWRSGWRSAWSSLSTQRASGSCSWTGKVCPGNHTPVASRVAMASIGLPWLLIINGLTVLLQFVPINESVQDFSNDLELAGVKGHVQREEHLISYVDVQQVQPNVKNPRAPSETLQVKG